MALGGPNIYPGSIWDCRQVHCQDPGAHRPQYKGGMRRFRVYRPEPPEHYREGGFANAPDEVQFEGCVFSDGTVAVRWMTQFRSTSIWASFEELLKVHGHSEYKTRIEWLDE